VPTPARHERFTINTAPSTVNIKVTTPPATPAGSASTKKLEQLKSLLNGGLITQAQYDKSSQEVLNQLVQ
jgi:hypothetical protein